MPLCILNQIWKEQFRCTFNLNCYFHWSFLLNVHSTILLIGIFIGHFLKFPIDYSVISYFYRTEDGLEFSWRQGGPTLMWIGLHCSNFEILMFGYFGWSRKVLMNLMIIADWTLFLIVISEHCVTCRVWSEKIKNFAWSDFI